MLRCHMIWGKKKQGKLKTIIIIKLSTSYPEVCAQHPVFSNEKQGYILQKHRYVGLVGLESHGLMAQVSGDRKM